MIVLALISFLLAAACAVARVAAPGAGGVWAGRWVFVLLLASALFAGQRDALRANFQLWNPDESQMLAGALTLQERPVFWRDVDGTTHGPLNQYPLLLPALAGARIDYTSARIVGACGTILLLLALHLAIAARHDEGVARLLVLPGWACFIFNQDPETAQYTSELMPGLLLATASALTPAALTAGRSASWCWAAGAAASAAPLAKLQAAPLGAWILLFIAAGLWRDSALAPAARRRRTGLLLLGAVSPWVVLVGPAAVLGGWTDFRIRYLETNLLGYAASGGKFFNDAFPTPGMLFGFGQFLWPVVAAIVAAGLAGRILRLRTDWRETGFALGLLVTALLAIYAPRKPFAHYFLLSVGPLLLLLAATAGPALASLAARLSPARRLLGAGLLAAGLTGFSAAHRIQHPDYFRLILRDRPPVARAVVEELQRRVAPGETLAVWGWQPALYVMTQTVAATPDLIVFWSAVPSPWRDFYQARYLHAFAARPPAVFVDTMGPADFFFFRNPAATRHETFPALAALLERDYALVATVAECRIYVRRESMSAAVP